MDKIVNQNFGNTHSKPVKLSSLHKYTYKKKRVNPLYTLEYCNSFPDELKDFLLLENEKAEKRDTILLTPNKNKY